jgi:hypothetical protein
LGRVGLDLPDAVQRVLQLTEHSGGPQQQNGNADRAGEQAAAWLIGLVDHRGDLFLAALADHARFFMHAGTSPQ